MKPLVANEEQIIQIIDRMVERTFAMDHSWDWPATSVDRYIIYGGLLPY
ncbi:hypothetical protein ACERJO_08305 [Halalkalibacter sp. AB-rgal2]